eukprot:Gb_35046 [translate_table: standard]
MEANACFFAVSLGPQFNTRSQPQPGAFAYTSTVSFHMVCYRSSFCANNRLNANPYNGSTRKFSLTFASDQSSETPSVADRVEDFAGALPGNEQVDGAVKFKKDFDGKSLKPMGLSVERELKPLSVKDYLDRARDMIKLENDTLHWFSPVECGCPPQNAPLLLFLPGSSSVGAGFLAQSRQIFRLGFGNWLCLIIRKEDGFKLFKVIRDKANGRAGQLFEVGQTKVREPSRIGRISHLKSGAYVPHEVLEQVVKYAKERKAICSVELIGVMGGQRSVLLGQRVPSDFE